MTRWIVGVVLAAACGVSLADERPYTDGSVWDMTMVRTADGMQSDYLESLRKNYKPIMDGAVKEGLILSHKIILTTNSGPDDWDVLLMTEYKNWAAFDGLSPKFEAVARKIITKKDEDKLMVQRLQVRRFVGSKNGQEIQLKP